MPAGAREQRPSARLIRGAGGSRRLHANLTINTLEPSLESLLSHRASADAPTLASNTPANFPRPPHERRTHAQDHGLPARDWLRTRFVPGSGSSDRRAAQGAAEPPFLVKPYLQLGHSPGPGKIRSCGTRATLTRAGPSSSGRGPAGAGNLARGRRFIGSRLTASRRTGCISPRSRARNRGSSSRTG